MIAFHSIGRKIENEIEIYAFDKLDGTNIQALWEWEDGFTVFGTRKRSFSTEESIYGESIALIKTTYEEPIRAIFEHHGVAQATCFFEFFGPSSFAGRHKHSDKKKTVLFDVYISNPPTGYVSPDRFMEYFATKVPTAPLLYKGFADESFVQQVKTGTLPGMSFEGVVCKGVKRTPEKKKEMIIFKLKNRAWINSLRSQCNGDNELFEKLS